ncbi:hypothetical protein RIF29_37542 [Crotalaria pallida]|uniref:Nuclear transport factor 2 domain-containing protein n=1 Tax=Crotalaria pallida TaxID=3830 RepID=A0AAN9HZ73_CROPI
MFILHSSTSFISSPVLLLNSSSSSSPLPLSSSSIKLTNTPFALPTLGVGTSQTTTTTRRQKWKVLNKSSGESLSLSKESAVTVKVASPATSTNTDADDIDYDDDSAAQVVRNFYARINAHDVDSVYNLISDNCVYEDLVFPRPFVGRQEILEFFKKFTNSTSIDLQFVIDDLSCEDSSSVGVIWHLEWKGKPFPFSKGCSFYRLEVINGKRQITYGRDSVEPAIKPGDAALAAIRSVTWLLQQFPQLADRL